MQSPKQFTRIGISYLEKAILEVLFQAMKSGNDPFVNVAEITRKIGVKAVWDKGEWAVRDVCRGLYQKKRVERKYSSTGKQIRGYRLTATEYNKRNG